MGEKVGIAIIGCGGMAGAHKNGFKALWERGIRDFEIVATCDIEEGRAVGMAEEIEKFQGKRPASYTDFEKMLSSESSIDAVDICTLHRNHHTIAVPCIEAGKHVTIEKPLAITMRAGKKILDAAERKGVVLQVAENYRRDPSHRAINWAIRRGMIGNIRMIYWIDVGERLWYWGWREHKLDAGGGWSLDGGVHFADLFRYHVGEVERLYAGVKAFHPYRYRNPEKREGPIEVDVEDTTIAVLHFRNGSMGQWTSTSAAPGEGFSRRVIYGDEGSIDFGSGLKARDKVIPIRELIEMFWSSISEEEKERLFPKGITDTVATELKEFVDAVRGISRVETDGVEGYKDEAISIALYESAWIDRPVRIEDIEELKVEGYQAEINRRLGIS
jgi:predicted dehydrogenase